MLHSALVLALALQAAPAVSTGTAPRDAVVQGPHRIVPAALDDGVPLPNPATGLPGPAGDQRLAPASGDPFFLGFAAGRYYPPAGERVDPALSALAAGGLADGRPRQEVFGFVMFERRITGDRVAQLEALGVRTFGLHPHYALRAAIPVAALDAVAALPFVRWVGAPRAWQKVHPLVAAAVADTESTAPVEVWIGLFESDLGASPTFVPGPRAVVADPSGLVTTLTPADTVSVLTRTDGWRERALEQDGFAPGDYSDGSRSFRAAVERQRIQDLVALDYVQFVSPHMDASAAHDESMPMVHADLARGVWNGGVSQEIVVGIVDSGMDVAHAGFGPYWAYGIDFTAEALGPWVDLRDHGSHVAGTVLGRATVEDSFAGAAPAVGTWGPAGRIFNMKIIDSLDNTTGVSFPALHATLRNSWTDGNGVTTPRPHVVNHSWGSGPTPGGWFGTEAQAVDWDTETYDNDQLHVFAAGNFSPGASTVSIQGSAKNVLTVGNVINYDDPVLGDPGSLFTTSSRGPTADDRWKPNVVAPGTSIMSIIAGTANTYSTKTGTSMATPHVTGIAAQLADHHSFLRYNPAALSALLMATALPKDDTAISTDASTHLDNFGTGRVDGYRAHYGADQEVLGFWSWPLDGSSAVEVDLPVLPGAQRITLVMHYIEPAASQGASEALVNDWDLWVDVAPFSPGSDSGEYFIHQSATNNTEVRVLSNPIAATHRLKLHPTDVTSTCKLGLAAVVSYGDVSPNGTLSVTVDDAFVQPGDGFAVTATVANPSHVASGVYLDTTVPAGTLSSAEVTLKDGASADLIGNSQGGFDVMLGNILGGQARSVTWGASWDQEGVLDWNVEAMADNWTDPTDTVSITVDGTPPGVAQGLVSTTHTPGVWSKVQDVAYAWNAAPDNLSGIDGYGILTATAAFIPGPQKDIGPVVAYAENLKSSATGYYFNLRAVDRSGNWSNAHATVGPLRIDSVPPSAPQNLTSLSHQLNVLSCDLDVTMAWNPAGDAHSGVAEYIWKWNHEVDTVLDDDDPDRVAGTALTKTLAPGTWFFHLAAIDHAGNVGPTVHLGAYVLDDQPWSTYCLSQMNTLGCVPVLSATGAPKRMASDFQVRADDLLPGKSAILFWGTQPDLKPFSGGTKCVKNPVVRTPLQDTGGNPNKPQCSGVASFDFTTLYMASKGLSAGQDVYCQVWSRDPNAFPVATNLTGGLQFTICD